MKYRIIERDNIFIIQEYKYNDWFDIPKKIWKIQFTL